VTVALGEATRVAVPTGVLAAVVAAVTVRADPTVGEESAVGAAGVAAGTAVGFVLAPQASRRTGRATSAPVRHRDSRCNE
jgi:hypothetical protein